LSADGSVEFLHVRVGHRQALIPNRPCSFAAGAVLFVFKKSGAQETLAQKNCRAGVNAYSPRHGYMSYMIQRCLYHDNDRGIFVYGSVSLGNVLALH
ncbi:hypothetical protein, partial [Cobetia amphilecti]|uniref:hypothetical protein n=1 Tax=Cobetia amphilecti TaxID=1055104 RepID=UPI00254EA1CF